MDAHMSSVRRASLVSNHTFGRGHLRRPVCAVRSRTYVANGMLLVSQDDAPSSLACSIPLCLGVGSLDFRVLTFVRVSEWLLLLWILDLLCLCSRWVRVG